MATFEEFLASDFDTLDHANLLTGSSRLRNAYLDVLGESKERQTQLQRLQDEQRVCSFPLSDSSIDPRPNWTRAELDDPEDHGRRGRDKHPTVITYEQGHDSCLKAINRKSLLKDNRKAIYSRLPSRRATTINIFKEYVPVEDAGTRCRYRVSTENHAPTGFDRHWTIHLKRLGWMTRFKIWTGQIRWLFVLLEQEQESQNEISWKEERKEL